MKNYTNGLTTKTKIIDLCKILFYEKGYNETTFTDICEKSQVNPGSIAYHYKNKKNIASIVYNEMMHMLDNSIAELFPYEDEVLQAIMGLGLHQKLLFDDPAYRRFSSQFSSEYIHAEALNQYTQIASKAYLLTVKYAGQKKADFLFTAFKGMDCYIEPYIEEHMDELKFDEIFQYSVELYYSFIRQDTLHHCIDRALDYLSQIVISADYFNVSVKRL